VLFARQSCVVLPKKCLVFFKLKGCRNVRVAGTVRKQRNPRLIFNFVNLKLNDYKTPEAAPPQMLEEIRACLSK
jgi:hypothetical protein